MKNALRVLTKILGLLGLIWSLYFTAINAFVISVTRVEPEQNQLLVMEQEVLASYLAITLAAFFGLIAVWEARDSRPTLGGTLLIISGVAGLAGFSILGGLISALFFGLPYSLLITAGILPLIKRNSWSNTAKRG